MPNPQPIEFTRPNHVRAMLPANASPTNAGRGFEFQNQVDDHLSLHLYGPIGYPKDWGGVEVQDVIDALNDHPEAQQIDLYIASNGGFVFDGVAIYNALVRHSAAVTAHIDASALSIASLIACSADEIKIAANAVMMIHDPASCACGTADEMRAEADALDVLKRAIASTYAARTGRGADEIKSAMSDETWFDADEAVAFGLADSITPAKEGVGSKATNTLDITQYRNVPQRAAAMFKPKPNPEESQVSEPTNETANTESQDQATDTPAASDPPVEDTPGEQVDDQPTEAEARAEAGKRFTDAFGDEGAKYFAEGLTYEEAAAKAYQDVKARNADLEKRLSASDRGGEAVNFDDDTSNNDQPKRGPRNTALASLIKVSK